jgi:hypothetical protein
VLQGGGIAREQALDIGLDPRKAASRIRPCLMTSARPERSSRSGKVLSVSMSASTSRGW